MVSGPYVLWGERDSEYHMNLTLLGFIMEKVGLKDHKIIWSGYADVGDISKSEELRKILASFVSTGNVSMEPEDRVRHSIGRGGADFIPLIEKRPIRLVDAVVYPTEDEVGRLLKAGNDQLEIIPFGGGTSVTGGVSPAGDRKYAVSVDLRKLDSVSVDADNLILEAGTGAKGPSIEEALANHGLTLGNFPESFKYSTLGGWIATNAAGQESNRYGKIKDMVMGVRMETPTDTYQDRIVPGESAFFKLSDLAVGSEGAFGIVTRAWLKVHPIPRRLYYNSYIFRSFDEGLKSLRNKITSDEIPMISRLSDEDETELSLMGIEDSALNNIFKMYVNLRVHNGPGSILITISDRREEVKFDGGIGLGSFPARFWYGERYSRPMMYNELLKRGIVAETIETSARWDLLSSLHISTKKIFEDTTKELGVKGMILCHSSHQYLSGSALYFTFIFYSSENRAFYLDKIRSAIMDNIMASGGSISHHHGVGTIQTKYLKDYKGNLYRIIQNTKSHFDPDNTMVPGILKTQ